MYGKENNHKLRFSLAETAAKTHKNIKSAYLYTATSILYRNKLPRIASRALRLLEKY